MPNSLFLKKKKKNVWNFLKYAYFFGCKMNNCNKYKNQFKGELGMRNCFLSTINPVRCL